jgi:ABC-type ATPase involved in cell division
VSEESNSDARRPEGPARIPLLELKGISKRFGAVQAMTNVNLKIYAGEVLALVGDNGAGKSTLVKAIAAIYIPDEGEILFEGKPVHFTGPRDPVALGISTVYQDLALCDNLDVVANLYLGREEVGAPIPGLSEEVMEKRAREVLRDLNVTTLQSPRLVVASLSGGQRQSVAVVHTNHPAGGYLITAPGRVVVWAPEFLEFPPWAEGADLMFAEAAGWDRPIRFARGTGGHMDAPVRGSPGSCSLGAASGLRAIGRPTIPAIDRRECPPFGEFASDGKVFRV